MLNFLKKTLLITVSVMFMAAPAFATEWYVDAAGSDPDYFLDLETAFLTLTPYSGTHNIVILEGDYSDEGLSVPGNITSVVGAGKGLVTFTGGGSAIFLDLTGAPAGFVLGGMTVTGYTDGIYSQGSDATVEDCDFIANERGVVLGGSSFDNTVQNNCFMLNTVQNAYDNDGGFTNVWDGNYYDDFTAGGTYTINPAPAVDANALTLDNSVVGQTTAELGETFTLDIVFTFPECDDTRNLAVYEFDVNYNASKLEFVSAGTGYNLEEIDPDGFFGPNDGGDALYTNIDGSTAGKVTFAASNFTVPRTETGFVGTVVFKALKANTSVGVWIGSIYRDDLGTDLVVGNTNHVITLLDVTAPTFSMTAYADDDNDPSALIPPIPDPVSGDDTYSQGGSGPGPHVMLYLDMTADDDYGLSHLEYAWDGGGWNFWFAVSEPYATVPPINLSLASRPDGAGSFSVRAVDAAPSPNYSDPVVYPFFMDRTGPDLVSVTMTNADGCAPDPLYTNNATVDLAFVDDGSTDIDEVEHTTTSWGAAVREAYAPAQYTLVPGTDGSYTLSTRLYDLWNNQGSPAVDAITLDTEAPVSTGFELALGAAKTKTLLTSGKVISWGGSGAYQINFSESEAAVDDCLDGGWAPITTNPFDVLLTVPDQEMKTIFFKTRDHAGNMSAVQSDMIFLDMAGPEIDAMSLASQNGAPCSPSYTVDVTVEWTEDDAIWLGLASTSGGALTWHDVSAVSAGPGPPYSFTVAYPITGGTDNADNSVFAKLQDDITNNGAEKFASIFVDRSNPGLSSIEMQDLTTASGIFSNDEEVAVVMSGSIDIKEICFSEDGSAFSAWEDVVFTTGSATVNYTFATPVTENAYLGLYAKVRDCSYRNNTYSDLPPGPGGIIFDLTDPVIGPISINSGAASTNNEVVSVDFPVTEQYPMTVTMCEDALLDPGDATYVSFAYAGGPAYSFTMSTGDGTHEVYVQLEDQAGNFSTIVMDDIILDKTPPTGTLDIVSSNPAAAAGYTNTATCLLNITWDDNLSGVRRFRVRNDGDPWVSPTSYHEPPVASIDPWTILWVFGLNNEVQIQFQDNAGTWGPVITDNIYADGGVPAPPTTFTAAASNSVDLEWSADPMDQYYLIKYNYNGDYPAYDLPNPPAPAWDEGFPADGAIEAWGTEKEFFGPHSDIYIFSIWTVNKCGTQSTAFTASNLSTDYILGDFTGGDSPDGCLDFDNEFFALAMAYDTEEGVDVEYDPLVDIAPTFCGNPDDYPLPDGFVDFEDFMIFGMNYRDHRCGENGGDAVAKPVVPAVAITADVPGFVQTGEEFSVVLRATNAEAILGYHLVLNYDENLELVAAEPGAMHESVDKAFFYKNTDAGVDIAAVALGGEFDGEEMTILSFRATADCEVTFDAVLLDVRDWTNKHIDVEFDVVAKVEVLVPTEFALSQNYPNPFNPNTVVCMSLPMASEYRLNIYNITGQLVESFSGYSEAGIITIEWDATEYSSGIYLYRMEAGSFTQTKKMVLLK